MIHTIIQWARIMVLEDSLPQHLWADAVATAVYIFHRSPSKVVRGKTPFEEWFGCRPKLAHLHRFGLNVYLHVPDAQRTAEAEGSLL